MTTGIVRLLGEKRYVNMALFLDAEGLEQGEREGIALTMFGGQKLRYWDDNAKRIAAWLKENSELPIIAP
jgi:hypothetical protein